MGSTNRVTVTNGKWCVGTISGSGIDGVRFEPFQRMSNGVYRRPACYGKLFPNQEAATAFSVEHGFSQIYYCRPSAFITLKLSPATRRYLKSITDYTKRWNALARILDTAQSVDGGRYFDGIRCAPFGAKTRAEWNLYLNGDFDALRKIKDQVFVLRSGNEEIWKAMLDGEVLSPDWNSKGAAQAGLEVERKRKSLAHPAKRGTLAG